MSKAHLARGVASVFVMARERPTILHFSADSDRRARSELHHADHEIIMAAQRDTGAYMITEVDR
ncbi:hypothetical protein H8B02_43970 [Bradyrhizobium sp. Pear77]|uniref:hypothetical protein n=1 Tax=Bradyrhizobium altum TaxID=1571202 RepID=UPI001E3378D2|nr:hypothetical protein [Bradyrhizobium altum]MCC8960117.1 hypothetical protein [Bradyrhizobium altum]